MTAINLNIYRKMLVVLALSVLTNVTWSAAFSDGTVDKPGFVNKAGKRIGNKADPVRNVEKVKDKVQSCDKCPKQTKCPDTTTPSECRKVYISKNGYKYSCEMKYVNDEGEFGCVTNEQIGKCCK